MVETVCTPSLQNHPFFPSHRSQQDTVRLCDAVLLLARLLCVHYRPASGDTSIKGHIGQSSIEAALTNVPVADTSLTQS